MPTFLPSSALPLTPADMALVDLARRTIEAIVPTPDGLVSIPAPDLLPLGFVPPAA